jgi:hypothetical protein
MVNVLVTAASGTTAMIVALLRTVQVGCNAMMVIVYRLLTLLLIVVMEYYSWEKNVMTVIVLAMMAVVANAS